jgi:hypothetical protein
MLLLRSRPDHSSQEEVLGADFFLLGSVLGSRFGVCGVGLIDSRTGSKFDGVGCWDLSIYSPTLVGAAVVRSIVVEAERCGLDFGGTRRSGRRERGWTRQGQRGRGHERRKRNGKVGSALSVWSLEILVDYKQSPPLLSCFYQVMFGRMENQLGLVGLGFLQEKKSGGAVWKKKNNLIISNVISTISLEFLCGGLFHIKIGVKQNYPSCIHLFVSTMHVFFLTSYEHFFKCFPVLQKEFRLSGAQILKF